MCLGFFNDKNRFRWQRKSVFFFPILVIVWKGGGGILLSNEDDKVKIHCYQRASQDRCCPSPTHPLHTHPSHATLYLKYFYVFEKAILGEPSYGEASLTQLVDSGDRCLTLSGGSIISRLGGLGTRPSSVSADVT